MVRGATYWKVAIALAALISLAHAQPQPPTTEAQARYYVYGAFLTQAVPEIMGERVTLGPELAQRLGLSSSGADRQLVYDALMIYTDKRQISVRRATSEEVAAYRAQAKRELADPLFTVQAGEIRLLVQYDLQANVIPYVGQLGVGLQPAPPVVERAGPAPVAATPAPAPKPAPVIAPVAPPVVPPPAPVAPKPVAPVAVVAPKPAPATEELRPNGPCVVKPVMSEQDLANCRAGVPAARVQPPPPPPPAIVKPQARAAPLRAPEARATGPCEIKPVMSEEDLANCRAAGPAPSAALPVLPPLKPQPRPAAVPAPQRPARAPCEIKPVMSEEDLANCR